MGTSRALIPIFAVLTVAGTSPYRLPVPPSLPEAVPTAAERGADEPTDGSSEEDTPPAGPTDGATAVWARDAHEAGGGRPGLATTAFGGARRSQPLHPPRRMMIPEKQASVPCPPLPPALQPNAPPLG